VPAIDLTALAVPFAVGDVLQSDANEPVVFGEGHVGGGAGRGPVELQLLAGGVRLEDGAALRDHHGGAGLDEVAGLHGLTIEPGNFPAHEL
jgi:hypothetical protein